MLDNQQTWTAEELRDLILYAKQLQQDNEDLQAKIIVMDAYVKNADAKIRQLQMILKQYII